MDDDCVLPQYHHCPNTVAVGKKGNAHNHFSNDDNDDLWKGKQDGGLPGCGVLYSRPSVLALVDEEG